MGNPILPNGMRSKGELFFDESVQKILRDGGVLDLFSDRTKYPRTHHLLWSPGIHDDDRVLHSMDNFIGKRVIVTTKMDGCFVGRTTITMADGTERTIRDLVSSNAVGESVMGRDNNGNIIPARITNVFCHGSEPAEGWVCVRVKGCKKLTYCTASHQYWVLGRGWVPASALKVGDSVLEVRNGLELTPLQEQVLLGKLLGDGSLHILPNRPVAHVAFNQKQDHAEYVEWCRRALGDLARGTCPTESGYGTPMLKAWTASLASIYHKFWRMLVADKKAVPADLALEIGPIALAFWYMDDGSLAHHPSQEDRARLHVANFDDASIERLQTALARFGVRSEMLLEKGYPYLYLHERDAERFFLLIAAYVPPVMQYKLPARYRGGSGWLPPAGSAGYRPWTRLREIEAVERRAHRVERMKYDLETETHNFFANGVLVHNSNTTCYPDSYVHSRSVDGRSHQTMDWVKAYWSQRASDLPEGWRLCGENLYAVHSIRYDNLPSYFFGFSIWNERNVCLSWDETIEWFSLLDIISVPVIYDGIYDETCIRGLFDPAQADRCEGYVMRLADQIAYGAFRTSVGKFVRRNHIQTAPHNWLRRTDFETNKLVSDFKFGR